MSYLRTPGSRRHYVPNFDYLPPGVIPFAVSREAALIGVSAAFFDRLVKDGRMPQPREVDGRVLWDSEEVRSAWRAIPRRGQAAARNPWDERAA
jgi:predicted DNA-binding transcriptional regulator AlpA